LYETISLRPPFRAADMEGLYKKVTRGSYGKIPSKYSNELAQIIKMLLRKKP
jgi:NIMA (never in mitosis gene a)-related kinase